MEIKVNKLIATARGIASTMRAEQDAVVLAQLYAASECVVARLESAIDDPLRGGEAKDALCRVRDSFAGLADMIDMGSSPDELEAEVHRQLAVVQECRTG